MASYIKFVRSGVEGERVLALKNDAMRWRWIVLLAKADAKTFPGLLATEDLNPYTDKDFCYFLKLGKREWIRTKNELLRVNLIATSEFFSKTFVTMVSYIPNQDIENQHKSRYGRTRIKVLIDSLLVSQGKKRELIIQLIQEFNIFKGIHYVPDEIFHNISTLFPQLFHNAATTPANENENENENDGSVVEINNLKINDSNKEIVDNSPEEETLKPSTQDEEIKSPFKEKTHTKKTLVTEIRFIFSQKRWELDNSVADQAFLLRIFGKNGIQQTKKLSDQEMAYQLNSFYLYWFKEDDKKTKEPRYIQIKSKEQIIDLLLGWLEIAKPELAAQGENKP